MNENMQHQRQRQHMMRPPQLDPYSPYDPTRQPSSYGFQSYSHGLPLKRTFSGAANSPIGAQDDSININSPTRAEDEDAPRSKRLRTTGQNQHETQNLHRDEQLHKLPALMPPFSPSSVIPERRAGVWNHLYGPTYAPNYAPTPLEPSPWPQAIPVLRPGSSLMSIYSASYPTQFPPYPFLRPPVRSPLYFPAGQRPASAEVPQCNYPGTHSEDNHQDSSRGFEHPESSCEDCYDSLSEGRGSYESSESGSQVDDESVLDQDDEVNERAGTSDSPLTGVSSAAANNLQSSFAQELSASDPISSAHKVQPEESKATEDCAWPGSETTSAPSTASEPHFESDESLENLMTNLMDALENRLGFDQMDTTVDNSTMNLEPLARGLWRCLLVFLEWRGYVSEGRYEFKPYANEVEDSDTSSVTLDGLKTPPPTTYPYPNTAPEEDDHAYASGDDGADYQEADEAGLLGERLAVKPQVPDVITIHDSDSEDEFVPQTPSKNEDEQKEVIIIHDSDSDSDIWSGVDESTDHAGMGESSASDVAQEAERTSDHTPFGRIGFLAPPSGSLIDERHGTPDLRKKEDTRPMARDEPRGFLAPPEQFHPQKAAYTPNYLHEGPDSEDKYYEAEEEGYESEIDDEYKEEEDPRSEVCIRTDGYCKHDEDPDTCERCPPLSYEESNFRAISTWIRETERSNNSSSGFEGCTSSYEAQPHEGSGGQAGGKPKREEAGWFKRGYHVPEVHTDNEDD